MPKSKDKISKKYYVYVWIITDTGEVFYIGKGSGNRYKTKKRENRFFTYIVETHDCEPIKIIEGLTEREAYDAEIETIKYYRENTDFRITNVTDGGDAPPRHCGENSPTKRPEVKEKISKSHKKLWQDEDYRDEVKKSMKDFYKTDAGKEVARKRTLANWEKDDFRLRVTSGMKSTMRSKDFRAKHSVIMKNAYSSQEVRDKVTGKNNGASRRINQYDLNMNKINEYDTLMDAERETGISVKNITKALRGHRKTASGFIWEFADNKNITYKKRKPYEKDVKRERIPVIQYDMQCNFIKEYDSVASATKENNLKNHTNIICNLKGRTKSAYGFIWKYKN